MAKPVLYGPAYSTYARTARLALEEKAVDYDLVEVDLLKGEAGASEHLARHPFGKVPAFEHDGFALYETDAITRYVNEAFQGPDLEPSDVRGRARMTQAINIADSYAYPSLITAVVIQRVVMPMLGNASDETVIEAGLPRARTSVAALEELIGGNAYLAGDTLSRADLLLIPIYDYFSPTPEGQKLLGSAPKLQRWWDKVRNRPSVEKTRPSFG